MSVYKNRPERSSTRGRWFLAAAILLTFTLVLTGCQSAPIKAATSAESAMTCHVADGLTTAIGISKGAIEMNPIMAPVVSALGPWGFFTLKVGIGYVIYRAWKDTDAQPTTRALIGLHNVVICGAAVNNINVIRSIP